MRLVYYTIRYAPTNQVGIPIVVAIMYLLPGLVSHTIHCCYCTVSAHDDVISLKTTSSWLLMIICSYC